MKNKRFEWAVRLVLFVGTAVSMFYVPWPIVLAWLSPLPDSVAEQVAQAPALGFSGVVVYVDKPPQAPQTYVAGWHDRDAGIPADPEALFKIGSVYKLYTAVAITKMARQGLLDLDDTVADVFPDLSGRIQNADRITLRLLVQHRSGIPNFTDMPGFWSDESRKGDWPLSLVFDQPADFLPDDNYGYSNTNYLLLRRLMDQTLGYSHHEFIKQQILDPLGLENTYPSIGVIDLSRLMSGYYVGVAGDIKTTDYGTMVATAADVGVFLRALNDGSVFADGEQALYSGLYVYDHTGLVPGYQTHATYYEDMDTVLVQFTNTTDFEGYNWGLADVLHSRIAKMLRASSQ